nr:hypothetical protein WMHIBSEC_WMHIBSEC_CDS_0082 [Caudoviricetes sp.]
MSLCLLYDTKVQIKCYPFVTREIFIYIICCITIYCNSNAINDPLVAI